MNLKIIAPRSALNKAYLKVKPTRQQIEKLKANLVTLLEHSNDRESEEHHKNLVSDFLKKTFYDPQFFINTKERKDLVIHTGPKPNDPAGVLIEAKKPTNRSEMPTSTNLNTKAFHELLYYYLEERIVQKNTSLTHLIITNIYEWYIFDAHRFETLFAQNKDLVRRYTEFSEKRATGYTTEYFYKEIAAPCIASLEQEISFTYFNIRDYEKPLRNQDPADDTKLIVLYKLFSPEHLLKLPFTNDSNSLDRRFYSELLHIIGLTETKDGGKKLIGRHKPADRLPGTILENAIAQLDASDKLSRLKKPAQYGATVDDRLFTVALELVITWINRILFLKLLEAQLIAYHKGDKHYGFLNDGKVSSYDDLQSLFFQVLARHHGDRSGDLLSRFEKVPYLNSSLFEPTDLEHEALMISNLRDDRPVPVYSGTVLKDTQGRKRTGEMDALTYMFRFLDAYDFSSEGSEDIQEENKSLINASVLGLIFEKINGYKDGSFFTPGFITMYMCRETIRRAVVQKFMDAKGWNEITFDELYNRIDDIGEANAIINSLRICDPAVGSGHFLVSALNEIIAVKNDLRILTDRNGRRLKEYHVEVVNDELIITDDDGELFEYHPGNKERQRVQEALFHEKQTLIENCLFGVDINPNSVKICRLRLWIELLKHAYYKNANELETLPNIDINIKCGNSLVSRFAIDADLRQALKKSKWTIDSYRMLVDRYRNAESKDEKREMERLIKEVKSDFQSEISRNDKLVKDLQKASGDLFNMTNQPRLFDMDKKEKSIFEKKIQEFSERVTKLEAKIEERRANKIFENAFEWRFEFPEVLNDEGDFVGFDVIIGNPPYIRQEELKELKPFFQNTYKTYAGTADLYVYFVERGLSLVRKDGQFIYILPNKWMRAGYGAGMRTYIKEFAIQHILDFGDLPVFEEATTYPLILHIKNSKREDQFVATNIDTLNFTDGLGKYVSDHGNSISMSSFGEAGLMLNDQSVQNLLAKIKGKGIPLLEYVDGKIYRGVLTGLNEAFVIDKSTRDRLIAEDPNNEKIIKPFLTGRDIKRYLQPRSDKYLIFTKRGIEIEKYPAILKYLSQFRVKLEPRPLDYTSNDWPGRKPGSYKWYEIQDAVDYFEEFEKEKIIIPAIVKSASYAYDKCQYYSNDKTTIISLPDFYLLALLNSKLIDFYLKNIASTKQNGYFEYKPIYIGQLPIHVPIESSKTKIVESVNLIFGSKVGNENSIASKCETQIDHLVYQIYELTEEEIGIVEGKV